MNSPPPSTLRHHSSVFYSPILTVTLLLIASANLAQTAAERTVLCGRGVKRGVLNPERQSTNTLQRVGVVNR